MSQHVYSLFEDKAHACSAYHELADRNGDDRCSVLVHENTVNDTDLPMGETHVARGAVFGAVLVGAAGAAIGGLIAGPAGLVGLGPLAAAAFTGGVGSVYGGFIGALAGASETDADQFEQALRNGKILIAAESCGEDNAGEIKSILARHGGRLVKG